jgi:adenosine deaminase
MTLMLSLEEFLRRIPKVDIHYHIMGGVSPNTMYELNLKYHGGLSYSQIEDYFVRDVNKSKGAIYALEMLYSLMREHDDLYRVAYEIGRSSSNNGVRYQELTWNPGEIAMPYTDATESLIAGFFKAEQDFGTVTRLIPGINRERSPEHAVEMVTDVVNHPYSEVIGIGMDYKEHDAPPEIFWKAYRIAKDAGLLLTAHCCEWEMHWRNLETALDLLQCDRIDHGYSVLDNEQLTARCRDNGVFFTVVPSNSYFWKKYGGNTPEWRSNHPLRRMLRSGLRIIPATDDPELHLTNATNCYRSLVEDFDFTIDDIRQCIINGIDGCWAPSDMKESWRRDWLIDFDDLRSRLTSI